MFQLESQGMRDTLRKMQPDCIEDIIAMARSTGPGRWTTSRRFIDCKYGDEQPDYLHPLLEPVLKETYGIIVYQEQVMQIAQILAGYSLGEADLLRRAMGKKNKAEMDAQQRALHLRAPSRGRRPGQADAIFELVAKFAGYGFNKSTPRPTRCSPTRPPGSRRTTRSSSSPPR